MRNDFHTKKESASWLGQAGFTLIEMVIVTAIFVIVIIVVSETFSRLFSRATSLSNREESNIEGIVGLEMFRKDLVQAGFGLPWDFAGDTPPVYNEATEDPANLYNDSGTVNRIPRAILAGNNLVVAGGPLPNTDYLVLKGTPLARNDTAQKWSYVKFGDPPKEWSNGSLNTGDRVIVLKRNFSETGYKSELMHVGDTFYCPYNTVGLPPAFSPQVQGETFYVYGISPDQNPRMPFNRSDYYVKRPASIPQSCADNTGVLYKSEVINIAGTGGGTRLEIPIMDCVADMQVVFGWDIDGDGNIDTYSDADGSTTSGTGTQTQVKAAISDAEVLRNTLKLVKVYLMVQDGKRDSTYRNSQKIIVGNETLGEESLTKKYEVADLDANNWTNYRWKVYRIVVTPLNLKAQ